MGVNPGDLTSCAQMWVLTSGIRPPYRKFNPGYLTSTTSAKKILNLSRPLRGSALEKRLEDQGFPPRCPVLRNRVFGKVITRPVTGKMKFCKRCHKRVVEVTSAGNPRILPTSNPGPFDIEAAREKALVKSGHVTPQIRDIFVTWPYHGYASTEGELIEVTEYFLKYLSKYIARDTNQDRMFLCHFFISAGIMFSQQTQLKFILTNAQKCSGERIYVYFLWE